MLHVSATSPQKSTSRNRTNSTRNRKEEYVHFEFLYINHSSRIENNTTTENYLLLECVSAYHTLKVDIDFSGGILSKGKSPIKSSSDSMRPTALQCYHMEVGHILSQRIGIFAVIVRNSLVVLIISISFLFPYVISIAYLPRRGQQSASFKKIAFFQ